ncbi:predicted protein [Histoplasma mississippiense (nom. inval.)]|uniref:predicted protein n=1 Tax=Ajellomyces capsulatus (strain NAm1 / WU24) TaxID=2059318 RepID=UPI000157BAA7|nr:predicted protein [Histoplasma mississippiense (nom. inval.)]EDN05890.1 predicted protein [Histoplasma mississippiense (nom. inval.)]
MPGTSDFSSHNHHHHLYTSPLKDNYRDDRFGEWIPAQTKIVCFVVSLILGYYIFKYLDLIVSTLLQTVWNIIVFITPSRIIFALDKGAAFDEDTELAATSLTREALHSAKSVAMQRILGLDANSLLTTLPRGRSLSGIGQAFLGLKEPCPPGLGNWDNSCYQNSIIQGFASLRALDKFLEENLRELGDRDPFYTHLALKEIIDKLNSPSYGGRKQWTPPELKSMSSWQQQDAQEYFSKVIDQVDKEIRRASKGLTSDVGLRFVDAERNNHRGGPVPAYETRQINDEHKPSRDGEYKRSTLLNPLEGLLAQRVGLSLGSNWEYDIRECLDEYTTLEAIEGVECAKCTLLRTEGQLGQLLQQIDSDAELEEGASTPQLTEALRNSAETRLKVVQKDYLRKMTSLKRHYLRRAIFPRGIVSRPPNQDKQSLQEHQSPLLSTKYSVESFPATVPQAVIDADGEKEVTERWFRLSDEDGGVFMLFYECVEQPRYAPTGSVDEKQPGQEDISLKEISSNSQGEEGGILCSACPNYEDGRDAI